MVRNGVGSEGGKVGSWPRWQEGGKGESKKGESQEVEMNRH